MSFSWLTWCHVFGTFVCFVGDFMVQIGPKGSAEVLTVAPEFRKAVVCSWREYVCPKSFVHV